MNLNHDIVFNFSCSTGTLSYYQCKIRIESDLLIDTLNGGLPNSRILKNSKVILKSKSYFLS